MRFYGWVAGMSTAPDVHGRTYRLCLDNPTTAHLPTRYRLVQEQGLRKRTPAPGLEECIPDRNDAATGALFLERGENTGKS